MLLDSTVEFWNDPLMPYVEIRRACQSRICYKSHSHPTFSIGAVDVGQSRFSSYFAQEQLLESGSVVVIPANVEHSCNPLPQHAWSYQMMHLDVEWLKTLMNELRIDQMLNSDLIAAKIPKIKPNILKNSKSYSAFTHLNNSLFDSEISIFQKEQNLVATLTEILLPDFDLQEIVPSNYYQQYLPQLIKCLSTDSENLSLQQLAEKMEISRYALIRLFKHYFGFTPHAYQLNTKINIARQRLQQRCDIAQLAYELNFTDQSHFQRVFKQHTGITPKQYSKKT